MASKRNRRKNRSFDEVRSSTAAQRRSAIDAYGHLHRSGGRRVWTQTNGKAAANKKAARGRPRLDD